MIKRFIFVLLTVNIFAFFQLFYPLSPTIAFAAEYDEYARILNDNTVMFADPNCTIAKFNLPYSYFVKVLAVNEYSVKVSYMDGKNNMPACIGYIKTADYYTFDYIPDSPYPQVTLTVLSSEVLFSDKAGQTPKTVLSEYATALYYGYVVTEGVEFYYVYSNGFVGYVRKNAFINTQIPPHTIPIESVSSEELSADNSIFSQQQTTPAATELDAVLKTIVIIAVSLVALSVVYLLFRPNAKVKDIALTKDYDDDY